MARWTASSVSQRVWYNLDTNSTGTRMNARDFGDETPSVVQFRRPRGDDFYPKVPYFPRLVTRKTTIARESEDRTEIYRAKLYVVVS